MPDISTLGGQIEIEAACQEADVIIVDNLSCLARSGHENEAESWGSIGEWALRMRSAGKCIIFMHHAGKNGTQRGTSKREDLLDIVIELKHPNDHKPRDGARFIVGFLKGRHLVGDEANAFEAWLKTGEDDKQFWEMTDAAESTYSQVVELSILGLTQAVIATELNVNRSTVCRHVQAAIDKGDLRPKSEGDIGKNSSKKTQNKRADIDD